MSAKTNHLRIGLFVLAAVFLFVMGLLAFGARSYFAKKVTLETAIEGDVTGLSVGSKVFLRGVPVGDVSGIDFAMHLYPGSTSRYIIVEYEIDRPVFVRGQTEAAREQYREEEIRQGLRAMVKGQGVTGTSILELQHVDPRRNPPQVLDYKPRYPFVPSAPGQFTRMLESIEQSLFNIQKLDFESIGLGASNTLAQTARLAEKLNALELRGTLGKVDGVLDGLKATAANIDAELKAMKLETLSRDARDLLAGLRDTNTKLQAAVGQAGTALERVDSLPLGDALDSLRTTLRALDEVLVELKRYPAGFLFGQPPLPARSVQPPAR